MKASKPLIFFGGAVVSAVALQRATHRRRTHTRRPAEHECLSTRRASWWVVPAALTVGSPHAWGFDPGAVWGGIWSFVGSIGSDIKSWVLEAIQKAADAIYAVINIVNDILTAGVHALEGGFEWLTVNAVNAAKAVAGVVEATYQVIDDWAVNIRRQIQDLLDHAWVDLKTWVFDQIPALLETLLGDVWTFLKSLVNVGLAGLDFLLSLATDPFGTIWHLIEQAVKDIVGVVVPPFEWIVQTGLDILFSGYGDVVAVLKGAWRFLVWVADHAADLTEEAITAGFGIGATAFDDQVVNTLTARSDDLESIVAKWFG